MSTSRPSTRRRVLVTGARAPAAVDLVRWLSLQRADVETADTLAFPTARWSRESRAYHRYPSPRHRREAFNAWMLRIGPQFDEIWPSCEEVFALAGTGLPQVVAPPLSTLLLAHDKGALASWLAAAQLGLTAPATAEVQVAPGDTLRVPSGYVGKPAFSRFGHRTLFGPALSPSSLNPERWLLQEQVDGEEVCSLTLADRGRVVAQVLYDDPARRPGEPCLVFRRREDPDLEAFCTAFCSALQWHGLIAFDFRRDAKGTWRVLEANPRLTSGIHLLLRPDAREVQLTPAVVLRRPRSLFDAAFWRRLGVLTRRADRGPALGALVCFAELQMRFGWPVAEASTRDIAYP